MLNIILNFVCFAFACSFFNQTFSMEKMKRMSGHIKPSKVIQVRGNAQETSSVGFEQWKVSCIPVLSVLEILSDKSSDKPIIIPNRSKQLCTNKELQLLSNSFDQLAHDNFTTYCNELSEEDYWDLLSIANKMNLVPLYKFLFMKQQCLPQEIKDQISALARLLIFNKYRTIAFPTNTVASAISPNGSQYALTLQGGMDDGYFLYNLSSFDPKPIFFNEENGVTLQKSKERSYRILFNNNSLITLMSPNRSLYLNCKNFPLDAVGAPENIYFSHSNKSVFSTTRSFRINSNDNINKDVYYSIHYKHLNDDIPYKYFYDNNNGLGLSTLVSWSPCDTYILFYSNQNKEKNDLFIINVAQLSPLSSTYIDVRKQKILCDINDEPIYNIAWNHLSTICVALSLRNIRLFDAEGKNLYTLPGKIFSQLKNCTHNIQAQCIKESSNAHDNLKSCTPFCKGKIAFSSYNTHCFIEQAQKNGIIVITLNVDQNNGEKSYTSKLIALENKQLGVENKNFVETLLTSNGALLIVLEKEKLLCYDTSTGLLCNSVDIDKNLEECKIHCNTNGTLLFLTYKSGMDLFILNNSSVDTLQKYVMHVHNEQKGIK